MKRPVALLVAMALMVGCKGSGGTVDPLFGRTRVAPPPTGVVGSPAPIAPNAYAPTGYPPRNTLPINVPANVPGTTPGGIVPTSPSTAPPANSAWTAPATGYSPLPDPSYASSIPGDRITIPMAARAVSDPPRQVATSDTTTRNVSAAPVPTPAAATVATRPASPVPTQSSVPSQPLGNRLVGREASVQVLEPLGGNLVPVPTNAPVPLDAVQTGTASAGSPARR